MLTKEELDKLTREQLVSLLLDDSKNVIAMDGVWFQAIEKEQGMDSAMHFDEEAWKVYTKAEARRIKKFLELEELCGLEGLAQALSYRMVDRPNPSETIISGNKLIYTIKVCRVQEARIRKGIVYTAPTAHFARYFCPLVPLLPTDVPNTHKHNFIV